MTPPDRDITPDPALKQARAEIEAIVRRYGIAGAFVLHRFDADAGAPPTGAAGGGLGNSEVWMQLCETAYSRLTQERMADGAIAMRVRSKRNDFPNAAAQALDMAGTLNMLELVGTGLGELALPVLHLAGEIRSRVDAISSPRRFRPDPPRGAN
jgi:hypothetical protein